MRCMTRCTCDCSGGPLGIGRSAGFGGGTCAGAPAQAKTSQRSQRVPIAPNLAHNCLLSCHARDPCNPAIGMHGELKPAPVQGAMHAPKSRCICIAELQPSQDQTHDAAHGTWSSKVHTTHAARAPGCFWSSAAGCALAEACRVPLPNACTAGA